MWPVSPFSNLEALICTCRVDTLQGIELAIADRYLPDTERELFEKIEELKFPCVLPDFLADYLIKYFGTGAVIDNTQYLVRRRQ